MNNPNPFLPQATLAEKQNQRRSRLKLAVSCVLAVSVLGLVAMLIQGCKRSDATADNPNPDNNPPAGDTNTAPTAPDTNVVTTPVPPMPNAGGSPAVNSQPGQPGQPAGGVPPVQTPVQPPVTQPNQLPPIPGPAAGADQGAPAAGGSEYTVVKGDSLAKIAKKTGVTRKALEAANPGVVPTKLKIGQKLTIPAGGTVAAPAAPGVVAPGTAAPAETAEAGAFETYTVKSGDTLHKIAKAHGTTVKAIQAANNLTTTAIKVGKKLKLPVKGGAAPAAGAALEQVSPPVLPVKGGATPEQVFPPVMPTAPAPQAVPVPTPNAPAGTPAGQ